MRILLVNPNTNAAMTGAMAASARAVASPGTEIVPLTPRFGADAIDCNFESYLSAVAVMDAVSTVDTGFDAVVMAGFGEHGREGMQELVDVPVLDIAECAAHVAQLLGRTYSVVTTLRRSVGAIEDRLLLAGQRARCASVRATGLGTAELDADPDAAVAAVVEQARLAVEVDGAEVICLGCGGLAGLDEAIGARLGVPVVDGVTAAVRLAEAVVGLGLRTSKVCSYAPPPGNALTGWPLSHLGGAR
ncbi:aspartate/glutamate racemase family protein [Luedemannella flava]|uniref:Aspartate/glutamate racemase family protein n=1 Tax=Luedemannella flava TaxID=349316 RepID=A0ABP4YAD6_9ACTN